MAAKSKDVGRDIAKLALADARFDTDTLDSVFAYCWEQICYRETGGQMLARLDIMRAKFGPRYPIATDHWRMADDA